MKCKIFFLLLLMSCASLLQGQDYREYYPILTAITNEDTSVQQALFRYINLKFSEIESENEAVQQVLDVRDSLSLLLTPYVRKWLKKNYQEDYTHVFDLHGELQPLAMTTHIEDDTLYALFALDNDYNLEIRSTVDFWMFLQYRNTLQYVDFSRKYNCAHEYAWAFFTVAKNYEELKNSYPESSYLSIMNEDYEYCLDQLMDVHQVQSADTIITIKDELWANGKNGMVDFGYYYSMSGVDHTNVDQLVEDLLASISVIEVDVNNHYKTLFLVSVGSYNSKADARKARLNHLKNGAAIAHLVEVKSGGVVKYHTVYRYYTSKDKANEALIKIRQSFPKAFLLKTDAQGNVL